MRKISLSWGKYSSLVFSLARKIRPKPQIIVCISRGGLVPGLLLSKRLSVPLAIIAAHGYIGARRLPGIRICPKIASTSPIRGSILLVDDVADSGRTFEKILPILSKKGSVKTAAVYKKSHSRFSPDYFAAQCKGSDWIVFPYD